MKSLSNLLSLMAIWAVVAALGCGEDKTIADRPKPKNYESKDVGLIEGYVENPLSAVLSASEIYGINTVIRWESSTQDMHDLRNCDVRERLVFKKVELPFINVPEGHEDVGKLWDGSRGNENIPDAHRWYRIGLAPNLVNGKCVVNLTVEYKYKDNKGDWNMLATYTITRSVSYVGQTWFFTTHIERTDQEAGPMHRVQRIQQVPWPEDWLRKLKIR